MFKQMFDASNEFRSCGMFLSGAAGIRAVPNSEAQLVLVEMVLPDFCGIDCARALASRKPGLKITLVTPFRDRGLLRRALAAGISDCLIKPLHSAQCMATLRLATWFTPRVPRSNNSNGLILLTGPDRKVTGTTITEREERVMACFSEGLLYKEIAERVGVNLAVLKKVQHRLFLKLGVHKGTEAVAKWRLLCTHQGPPLQSVRRKCD
jgi:DNA-binding NarL/FixJ family response regulator